MVTIKHDSNTGITIGAINSSINPKITNQQSLVNTISADSIERVIVDDKIVDRGLEALVAYDIDFTITSLSYPIYTSSNEAIATVDVNGYVTFVSEGDVDINIDCGIYGKLKSTLSMETSGGQMSETFVDWVSGSLMKETIDTIDTAIDGLVASTAKPIFTTQNHTDGIYVRNTNCWLNPWVSKLTALSPWNSNGTHTRAGTLITPRHVIYAAHYTLGINTTMRFIDVNNNVYTRTVIRQKNDPAYAGSSNGYTNDFCVGLLDSDLPNDIEICKILPVDFVDHFGDINFGVPAFVTDKEEKGLIAELYRSLDDTYARAYFKYPTTSPRLDYSEPIIGGDSGNPSFLIIDDELVLISVWTFGGAGIGTSLGLRTDNINQLIADVDAQEGISTGYTVTSKDLSAYPKYV